MKKYSVSISRQFGSLGRPIARELSGLLGVEYYDRDIVDMVSEKMGLPVKEISDLEETAATGWARMKNPLGGGTSEMQDRIFSVQAQIIRELAEKESCIIVGRCADSILENFENHISIYIYATYEDRIVNCVNELGMGIREARRMIQEVDRARTAYHMKYAKYPPNDPDHMDLMINSGLMGVEKTAAFLADQIRKLFEEE